jgi:Zn-dependent M32 family carboxypeptidase
VLRIDNPLATSFYAKPEAGSYLRDKVFAPGNLHAWNDLTKLATGETLTAKYFAKQFVE